MNDKKEYVTKAINIIESLGWNCDYIKEDNLIEVEKVISGKDIIECYICGDKAADLIKEAERDYDNFDIDYETYIWIGADGHGAHGAPYHIKDILSTAETHRKELGKILTELKKGLS